MVTVEANSAAEAKRIAEDATRHAAGTNLRLWGASGEGRLTGVLKVGRPE